ncbi:MAG: multidrug resistance efflux transporter family protein [Clostridiales bacterium]|nr:multidrug resistance efflux transporter family protein [Clostridiales bacterium]
MKKALFYGILSSAFFAFTFILNRSMNLTGGYWVWSASLRYFFSLPMLFAIVAVKGNVKPVFEEIKKKPLPWIIWSTVGFGLFYAPLTWASEFGESWLVASLWQLTIVAGVFLNPLWGKKIPMKSLLTILIILVGVFFMQWENFINGSQQKNVINCVILIAIAAITYPLGNRKMMSVCEDRLDTPQRVLGMTICSIPFWILLSIFGGVAHGGPSATQSVQSLLVALFSAVIATLLFFQATNMVRNHPKQLSMVEGTIAGEVIFTLIGGILFLHDSIPTGIQFIGIGLILIGMILNCRVASEESVELE